MDIVYVELPILASYDVVHDAWMGAIEGTDIVDVVIVKFGFIGNVFFQPVIVMPEGVKIGCLLLHQRRGSDI